VADHLCILCLQVLGRKLLLHLADHLCILCLQVLGRELLLHLADHLFILCVQVLGRELLLHLADHLCILCVQVLGRELLLHLADHLCTSYLAGDPDTRKLVDSTRIHLIPSMNPDGWKIATENVRWIIFFIKSKKKCYIC
jgi:hypothetical protein